MTTTTSTSKRLDKITERRTSRRTARRPVQGITVRFSDGIDYGGTVQKLLDGNKAFVLYDDGQSEAVQFPIPT